MIWTVPNILTFARLVAAALLPVAYLVLPHPSADAVVLVLFALASLTDYFDGMLARRWNQTTRLGRLLDPIADKAMVAAALLALCGLYGAHWLVMLPACAILIREFAVSGLREFLAGQPLDLSPSLLAKWKTTVQMTGISVLLLSLYMNFAGYQTACVICGRPALGVLDLCGIALLWLAAAMTVLSGWQYFAKGWTLVLGEEAR